MRRSGKSQRPAEERAPEPKKLSYRAFVEKAIKSLRKPPYKGIHIVYSGFNEAFRQYFGEEPRPIVDKLVAEGFIALRPARGGALLLLATDVEERKSKSSGSNVSKALAAILAGKN